MTDRTVSVRLQAQVSDYMAKFSAAGKATTDFANKVDSAKGKTAAGFQSMGRGAMVAGGLVLAGFALAEHEMASFENRMQLVATLSHASAADMRQLHQAALTVGQAYGFTANQVADAEAELVKAGVSVRDIMGGALTGALTLAAAGQTDVAEATTIAATAMTQFQLSGKDVPHIADLLASGADKALGSVADLGYALDQAGPQAHQFHVSIEETIGTLAAFAQAGQIGERGGTVFSQMLLKLAAPGQEASGLLKTLGITLYDTGGRFVGIANLAGQLQTKMSGLSEEERNHALAVIFGARAIRGANILYQDGAKGIADWTKKVNDSGFAALQAAGKMNSLSGDVTKFKSALQEAFIGAGEGANGPLRSLVRDATGVVKAWNDLPGPVRTGAEALLFAGGATLFLGGAAITLIPKIQATRLALTEMGISARGVAGVVGKAGLFGVAIGATAGAVVAFEDAINGVHYSVDGMKASLEDFATAGSISGELTKAFGPGLQDMAAALKKADDGFSVFGVHFHLTSFKMGSDFANARHAFETTDAALAQLASSGHADQAAQAYQSLSTAAQLQGISVDKLAQSFPQYQAALGLAASQQDTTASASSRLGAALGGQAESLNTAADAAKNYNDTLHAMADPIFGLAKALKDVKAAQDAANDAAAGGKSKDALTAHKALAAAEAEYNKVTHEKKPKADAVAAALARVRDAQKAYTQAVKDHLPSSAAAKQANIDLATASLDVTTAAAVLSAGLKDGTTSAEQMADQLRTWQREGLLTKKQADDVARSLGIVIGKAHALDGTDVKVTVKADVKHALAGLSAVARAAAQLAPLLGPLAGFTPETKPNGLGGLLGAGVQGPKYQASSATHVVVKSQSVPQSNTNTTNIGHATFNDTKAFDEFRRRQRRSRAVLG